LHKGDTHVANNFSENLQTKEKRAEKWHWPKAEAIEKGKLNSEVL